MSRESIIRLLRRIWRLLDARQRRRFVRLQALSLLMAFSTLLGVTAVVPFLAVFADPTFVERHRWLENAQVALGFADHASFVACLGVAFVVLVCAANAINLAGNAAIKRFAHDVAAQFQGALFDEYLRRDLVFHARSDSAVLASRVVYQVDALAIGILQNSLLLVTGAATSVFIFASVLLFNAWAALLAVTVFGGCYAAIYFGVRRRLHENGRLQSARWSERARVLAESFGAIREILLLRNQRFFGELFASRASGIARTAADTLTIAQLPRQLVECIAAAGLVGAALWFGRAGDARWVAGVTFLALAAYRLLPALQQAFAALAHINAERAAFEGIEQDLLAAAAPRKSPPPPARDDWQGRPPREICLKNVSFRYAAHLPLAVNDVSLRIPAGALVALIGANGSGKSTLADLIAGLLAPESGSVLIDGETLDAQNAAAWQSRIAYVPQSVFLHNASVAENIALGVPRERIDAGRLRAAVDQAQLRSFVDSLPDGLDEPIGERGVRASGGQRQLIGIARALYRDASVLLLDEATSALDPVNERRVLAALRAGAAPRTLIVIAHHAAALRACDLTFELDRGALLPAAAAYAAGHGAAERR